MIRARRLLAVAGGLAMGVAALQGSAVASTPDSSALLMRPGAHHALTLRAANGVAANTNDPFIAGYIGPVTGNQTYIARFQIPLTGTCTSTDVAVAVVSLVGTETSPAAGLVAFSGCQGGVAFTEVDQFASDGTGVVATGTYLPGDVLTMKVTDGATNVNSFRNETRPGGVKTVTGPAINPTLFNFFDNRVTFDGVTAALVQPFGTQSPDGAQVNGTALNAVVGTTVYDMVNEATPTTKCITTTPVSATSPFFTWKRVGPTFC